MDLHDAGMLAGKLQMPPGAIYRVGRTHIDIYYGNGGVSIPLSSSIAEMQWQIDGRWPHLARCTAHQTETPEERQRKLDEARKRVQQGQMAAQVASGMDAASPLPPWGLVEREARSIPQTHGHYVSGDAGGKPVDDPRCTPDFGAQVSDQLAQQRGIDPKAANDHMRVRTFEEQEAERARMAEHFRRAGIL